MNDLISRQAALEHLKKRLYETALNNDADYPYCEIADNRVSVWLEEVPTIEPKHGTWVERGENDDGTHNIQCSACDAGYKSRGHANSINTRRRFHFCPNCGAMMERSE